METVLDGCALDLFYLWDIVCHRLCVYGGYDLECHDDDVLKDVSKNVLYFEKGGHVL